MDMHTRTPPELPPLPAELYEIVSYLTCEPQNPAEVAEHIDLHALQLIEYVYRSREVVRDRLQSRPDKSYLSGLGRELQSMYSVSGLRSRIRELLQISSRLELPPSDTLLQLIGLLDGDTGNTPPAEWFKAVRLWNRSREPGAHALSQLGLAKAIGVPVSTLRGWMGTEDWRRDVEYDRRGLEQGFPQLYFGPIRQ